MYNATRKAILVMAIIAMASCKSESQREYEAAQSLAIQAQTALDNNNYQLAMDLIDSLNRVYPKQVELRRSSMPIRAKAMIAYCENQLVSTDSLISVLEDRLGDMNTRYVHMPDVDGGEGYYVAKSAYNPNFGTSTGIEARISDVDFGFYLVAINSEKNKVGVNSIQVESPIGKAQSLVLTDDRVGDTDTYGIDMATFYPDEVKDLCQWLTDNSSQAAKVTLRGTQGSTTVDIKSGQMAAIAQTWTDGDNASRLFHARRLRDNLEQQLIVARDHEVNL